MSEQRNSRDLGEGFRQHFELLPALDEASRNEVYRIRHEVYCRDLGWEPLQPNGLEKDGFDDQSLHILLRHQATGEPVGCIRLILARDDAPAVLLPFEKSCADVLDRQYIDPAALPRGSMAEVSRLAVMRNFRQRKGESSSAASISDPDFQQRGPQTRFPFIPVGLYLGVAAIAKRLGREYVFVLTEPRLAEHFARIGFNIEKVGGVIEHRGERLPSMFRISQFVPSLRPMIRPLYDVIESSVNQAFDAAGR